jgi:hypothetical protein
MVPDVIHGNCAQRSFPENRHSSADRAPYSWICRTKQRNRRTSPVCSKVCDSGIVANESAAGTYLLGNLLKAQAMQVRSIGCQLRFAGSGQNDGIGNLLREFLKPGPALRRTATAGMEDHPAGSFPPQVRVIRHREMGCRQQMFCGMNIFRECLCVEDLINTRCPKVIGNDGVLHPDPGRVEVEAGNRPGEKAGPRGRLNGMDAFDWNKSRRQGQGVRIADQSEAGMRLAKGKRTQNWNIQDEVPNCACPDDKNPPVQVHSWPDSPFPETQYRLDLRASAKVQ